jgi:hypothetical protein
MTIDWVVVYVQERKRPAYVINDGRSIAKVYGSNAQQRDAKPSRREQKKAREPGSSEAPLQLSRLWSSYRCRQMRASQGTRSDGI